MDRVKCVYTHVPFTTFMLGGQDIFGVLGSMKSSDGKITRYKNTAINIRTIAITTEA